MTPRWLKILQKLQASTRVVSGPLPTPCWEWTGPDDGEQGYGRMSLDGATVKVHRVSFMHFNGYLPPRKHVDHLCKNRRCWNPEHLEAVTHRENQKRRRGDYQATSVMKSIFSLTPELSEWAKERMVYMAGQTFLARVECHCDSTGLSPTTHCKGCPRWGGQEPAFHVLESYDPAVSAMVQRAQPGSGAPFQCILPVYPPGREPGAGGPPLGSEVPLGGLTADQHEKSCRTSYLAEK